MQYTKTTFETGWKPITKEDLEMLIGLRAKDGKVVTEVFVNGEMISSVETKR